MAISSALPSVTPFPVQPATVRGSVPPVTASESRSIAESRNPETARATDEAPENRDARNEQRPDAGKDKTSQNDHRNGAKTNCDKAVMKCA